MEIIGKTDLFGSQVVRSSNDQGDGFTLVAIPDSILKDAKSGKGLTGFIGSPGKDGTWGMAFVNINGKSIGIQLSLFLGDAKESKSPKLF